MEDVEGYVAKLKVVDLREELKKRSLSYAGNKSVLANRLQEAMETEKQESGDGSPTAENDVTEDDVDVTKVLEDDVKEVAEDDVTEDDVDVTDEQEDNVTEDDVDVTEVAEGDVTEVAEDDTTQGEGDTKEDQQEQAEITNTDEPEITNTEEPEITNTEEPMTTDDQPKDEEANVTDDTVPEAVEGSSIDKQCVTDDATPTTDDATPTTDDATPTTDTAPGVDTMDTSDSTQQVKNGDSEAELGGKRSHDIEGEEPKKGDPASVPDPEEPKSFDESLSLMEDKFVPLEDNSIITLDKYTSDMYFCFNEDGLGGCGLTEHGFARLWAIARANTGVKGGKYCYSVIVEENKMVDLPETEGEHHAIRVGWCLYNNRRDVGMDKYSYGYDSTAKMVTNNNHDAYGEEFGPGDTITCFLDLDSSPATVSYAKNNVHLGTAFILDESFSGSTLYPSLATKNTSFTLSFKGCVEVEGMEEYKFLQEAEEEHKIRAPKGPANAEECEIVVMVGLPASGKTTWAEKHCDKFPDKRYTILGANLILSRMKVTGLSKKDDSSKRHNDIMEEANEIINKLFLLAGTSHKNYILDQTNVYRVSQTRKMKFFDGYIRKAQVVVPPHHELRRRIGLRNVEMGGAFPDDVINAMKANFYIPKASDGVFSEIGYSDIYGVAAEKIVRQYREDALGLPSYPQSKRGRYDPRGGSRYNYGRGGSGGGGGQYGHHQQQQQQHQGSYGYSPRGQYGYGGGPQYGYSPRPRYSPYGGQPPHQMYNSSPRGGGGGGGGGNYGQPQQQYRPYNSPGQYRGGPPPPRRGGGGGGGYYGRY